MRNSKPCVLQWGTSPFIRETNEAMLSLDAKSKGLNTIFLNPASLSFSAASVPFSALRVAKMATSTAGLIIFKVSRPMP